MIRPVAGRCLVLALLLASAALVGLMTRSTSAGTTITVNSTADPGNGVCDVAECTLAEAISESNANAAVTDTILFDAAVFPPNSPETISIASALPASTNPSGVSIIGPTGGVVIDGTGAAASAIGLHFHSSAGVPLSNVEIESVIVHNFDGIGVKVCGGPAATCDEDISSTTLTSLETNDNGEEGLRLVGNNISDTELGDCTSTGNAQAGILLTAEAQVDATEIDGCTSGDNGTQAYRFFGVGGISNTTVTNTSAFSTPNDGLWLRSPDGAITNTTISDYSADDVATGIHFDAEGNVIDATVTNATLNNNTTGTKVESDNGDITNVTYTNSETNSNSSHGILIDGGGTLSGIEIEDCNSDDNGDKGLEVLADTGVDNFTASGCSFSRNADHGINIRPGAGGDIVNVTIDDVVANDNGNYGINPNANGRNITSFTVLDTEASGNSSDGVYINGLGGDLQDVAVTSLTASDNDFDGLDIATSGSGTFSNVTVTSGTFLDNGSDGISLRGDSTVAFNRIVGNGNGVLQELAGSVDAEDNWWGCNAGPADPDCDSTSGTVDSDPWLVMSLSADPDQISTAETSALTAGLNINSDATDVSGLGSIPDGTSILFSTDVGSVGSSTVAKPTSGGLAHATLTPDAGPGTASVSSTLDNQTVATTVTVTEPEFLKGDFNCDGLINATDALYLLLFLGSNPVGVPNCPEIGSGAGDALIGDINCDGEITPDDLVLILQASAGGSVTLPVGCPPIGAPFSAS